MRHGFLLVIGLNPSTADETLDDPTIRRCVDFAKRWGFGSLCMMNLFAWRDTKPENMKRASDPIGPLNDSHLIARASEAGIVLAAWGKDGAFMSRANEIYEKLSVNMHILMRCLRRNKDGSPQHPLYVAANTIPTPWRP